MSSQRPSAASPLKDRLLSNSPDPVQSSIIRDSAKGWGKSSSPNSNAGTTPLRIAKREGKPPFPLVARRSSSSYKHLKNSNLVSKSPFKTQTATPSRPSTSSSSETPSTQPVTRRVSGEKRPRPDSMHEQAENERPLAFKRERRQSKAYQGLIEKEPVTKSPFRRLASGEEALEEPAPPLPPKPTFTPAPPPPPAPAPPSPPPAQAPPSRPVTPSRPSLVSRRLHGPRAADHPSLDGRRQRRKTVTFDERCDVLEFDRDESDEDPFFSSDEDDYGQNEQAPELEPQGHDIGDSADFVEDSIESTQGEADLSLTCVVDNMIQTAYVPGLGLPSTPSRSSPLPPDTDTEDGIPYGRSHHAERSRRRASVSSPAMYFPSYSFPNSERSEQDSPSTPPQVADSVMDISGSEEYVAGSMHAERAHEVHQPHEVEEDVNMMPPSPSPAKTAVRNELPNEDSLIPKFELQAPPSESSPKNSAAELPIGDPFSVPIPRIKEDVGESSFTSLEDPMDPANLSIGQSEVSLSNLDLEAELQKVLNPTQGEHKDNVPRLSDLLPRNSSLTTSSPPPPHISLGVSTGSAYVSADERSIEREASPMLHIRSQSPMSPVLNSASGVETQVSNSPTAINKRRRSDSPLNVPSRLTSISPGISSASPSTRTGSPLRESASAQELHNRIPWIKREDVQLRLMRKRSTDSPLGSPVPGSPIVAPVPLPTDNVELEEKVEEEPIEGMDTAEIGEAAPDVEQAEMEAQEEEAEREKDRRPDNMSVMTDVSAELATIQTAEKRVMNSANVSAENNLSLSKVEEDDADPMDESALPATRSQILPSRPLPTRPQSSYGMLETSFDRSGSLGLGLRDSMGSLQLSEMRSALDRLMDDVKGSSGQNPQNSDPRSQVRVELMTEGIKAGQFGASLSGATGDESMQTETDMDFSMDDHRPMLHPSKVGPIPIQRAATDSVVYSGPSFRSPVEDAPVAFSPTKDAIRMREEMILEKRREARRREEDESMGYSTPPRPTSVPPSSGGRPSRRRSRSTGDTGALTKHDLLLDIGISETAEELLADSISKELRKLDPEHRQGYRVREHEAIFASADAEQVSHTLFAGDVNGGKAWKAVRRPSDMNEYAKQIREYRSQEKPGKSHGKVFVRVLGVKGLKVPIPQQPTVLTCTLNNGIHFVTTPETRLAQDTHIEQEFELIEHNKLEFTLTLKIKPAPHIAAQFKALVPPKPAPPQPVAPPPKPKGGVFSFFSSSPKKPATRPTPPPPAPPPHKLPDNLARYLKQDGTLARAFIAFKEVAARCDTRVLEVSYPLIGQRAEASGSATTMELGEIVLQLFRLPSLPGVLSNQLPLSMEESLRGLRHVAWHKVTYFEGTLTQNGGDCTTWRRRTFRVTGANLIAFSDVTKKATATINLKKAIAVEDIENQSQGRYRDDYDSLFAVERSFKLVFPEDQQIFFFADSDEEKTRWLEVLRALVGHIPPNPLWAELVWERQQELAKPSSASS